MEPKKTLTHDQLKTPRAAAVAGIVFSVLFIVSLVLIRTAGLPTRWIQAPGLPAT
jgi:hypothetical protein